MNIRNNFSRLADKLIAERDTIAAVKVLDRCVELMPHEKVEYNYFMLPIAENYYAASNKVKGKAIIATMTKMLEDKLNYLNQFEGMRKQC